MAAQSRFECAVFGRPVFFIDDNPAADKKAEQTLREIAIDAGFKEIAFQYEPIAAALDYESRIEQDGTGASGGYRWWYRRFFGDPFIS